MATFPFNSMKVSESDDEEIPFVIARDLVQGAKALTEEEIVAIAFALDSLVSFDTEEPPTMWKIRSRLLALSPRM